MLIYLYTLKTPVSQEVPDSEEVTSVLYVYTDFIKLKESSQASAAAQHFEEFGNSEVRPTGREETVVLYWVTNDQSTPRPEAGEDK